MVGCLSAVRFGPHLLAGRGEFEGGLDELCAVPQADDERSPITALAWGTSPTATSSHSRPNRPTGTPSRASRGTTKETVSDERRSIEPLRQTTRPLAAGISSPLGDRSGYSWQGQAGR